MKEKQRDAFLVEIIFLIKNRKSIIQFNFDIFLASYPENHSEKFKIINKFN